MAYGVFISENLKTWLPELLPEDSNTSLQRPGTFAVLNTTLHSLYISNTHMQLLKQIGIFCDDCHLFLYMF